MTTNTHEKYKTIGHEHLDSLVNWALDDYPSSGLLLIECADGRYFIGVDFGVEFDLIDGVSKPKIEPYIEPKFFAEKTLAITFAIQVIKIVYPELKERDLNKYFTEE